MNNINEDYIIEDRSLIILSVLQGILPESYVTLEEINNVTSQLFDIVCKQYSPFPISETAH